MSKARCPTCAKVLRVYVPAGGDGSAEVFPRHYVGGQRDVRCTNSRCVVTTEDYALAKGIGEEMTDA